MENRRTFIRKSAMDAAGVSMGLSALPARSYARIPGANDGVNLAVIGLRGRGQELINDFSSMYGKHVYVEKPSSHNIFEGRKMVDAARKYNRAGSTLEFNGEFETFIDDDEANLLLTRKYRYPFVVPETV